MKLFNTVVFLLAISITALTIPSMIPNVTFLIVFLLVVALLFNIFFMKHNIELIHPDYNKFNTISFSNLTLPIAALFCLFLYLFFKSFNELSNIYANANLFVMHALFLLFIVNTREHIVSYIKAYILLAVVMSTCGILAQLIVEAGLNPDGSYVNLGELTHGAYSRDTGSDSSYIFPYNLGLILVGDGKF